MHSPKDGANFFKAKGDDLSPLALNFLGGMLAHARSFTCITNPLCNSYKRLHATTTESGSTWSTAVVSWGANDRTHLVRVPDAPRLELRLPDMAADPYLMTAAILAAGLDGIDRSLDPGPQAKVPASKLPQEGLQRLPGNLLDALRALEDDAELRAALGEEYVSAYLKLKYEEWDEYSAQISQWEVDRYLDV